ncbi:UDP-2,4-diacetamido-2,4,6-trideoxy-beta-L-altropyranose hydrolase [Psychrobacter sp. DD43]|uniref:UDP-2,4-diacetamido-2,4, 6-trideoxy-beta-L-altropyranose hydrolase n=1 Tax=Psychrobacter sp. DD43 TaxID=2774128 RepID=UPI001918E1F2|nr:UDP-2,4-diacetamido-2,4,6-trideoxy-beta-L-altropyranose hydrolase [Psychrobacter sp. DD43]
MRVIFRCDASIQIGTGHVMRCLTLADALAARGAVCYFICREHEGHLLEVIRKGGHQVYSLPFKADVEKSGKNGIKLLHADWLGATQQEDTQQCIDIIKLIEPDWLIVDHYAIDIVWEKMLRPYCKKLMVIDDLADRAHDCDILLDQTFGRHTEDYLDWIPDNCQVLCGSKYALLRPEFAKWRDYSLERRKDGMLKHLLINLGGVDKDNITSKILKGLQNSSLPECCKITVVMGSTAPWIESVKAQAKALPWKTQVKSGVNNMAELMANSDLAIGAAGSTSWERCCLGLPTVMLVLAENQLLIAKNLEETGAVLLTKLNETLIADLGIEYIIRNDNLLFMSKAARLICDGLGAQRASKLLTNNSKDTF